MASARAVGVRLGAKGFRPKGLKAAQRWTGNERARLCHSSGDQRTVEVDDCGHLRAKTTGMLPKSAACVRARVRGPATCTCYGGVVWVWPQSGRSVRTYVYAALQDRTGPDRLCWKLT